MFGIDPRVLSIIAMQDRIRNPNNGPRPRDNNTHYSHGTPDPPTGHRRDPEIPMGAPPPVFPRDVSPDVAAALMAAMAQHGATVNPLGISAHMAAPAQGGLGGEGTYGGDQYAHQGFNGGGMLPRTGGLVAPSVRPPIPFHAALAASQAPAHLPTGGHPFPPRHAVAPTAPNHLSGFFG